ALDGNRSCKEDLQPKTQARAIDSRERAEATGGLELAAQRIRVPSVSRKTFAGCLMRREKRREEFEQRYRAEQERKRAKRKRKNWSEGGFASGGNDDWAVEDHG